MDQLFDKLPYDKLKEVPLVHLLGGAFGLGVVLYVIFHFTLYSTLQDEFAVLQTKKTGAEKKLRTYQATLRQKSVISEELATIQGELAQIKHQMPRRREIVNFVKQISEIGSALGLNILLIRSLQEETNDFYKKTPIKINVQGGFYKTLGFLDAVQNLLRLVNITQLNVETATIQSGPGGSGKTLITTSVAVAYSYIDGSEDKPAAKPKKKT